MRPSNTSTLKLYASLNYQQQQKLLAELAERSGLTLEQVKGKILREWRILGRPKQQAPPGSWTYWFLRCGRGFGKTLTAAQWARQKALEHPRCRIALVAPTFADGRDTMVEGETGLLTILADDELLGGSRDHAWNRSTYELYLANGSRFRIFSSEKPDRLRGPQHHFAWCEEISSWNDANHGDILESTWSNVKLGTRLGANPQFVITSTPKPNKLTKTLLAIPHPRLELVVGSSYENRDNLSEAWWQEVVAPYEGTRLGRQEIHAEMLEDVEGALWTRSMIESIRIPVGTEPPMRRIVVAVDPNTTSGEAANDAGIIVAGEGQSVAAEPGQAGERLGFVLADRTSTRGGPRAWARAAVDAYHEFQADRIVAEVNNGGEMVVLTIKAVDPTVPVKVVNASRGKRTRAEPISALYEADPEHEKQAKVRHVGPFPELEDEMTTWTPEGESPNRMDALVWALTELKIWTAPPPRGRRSSVPRGMIPVNEAARGVSRM